MPFQLGTLPADQILAACGGRAHRGIVVSMEIAGLTLAAVYEREVGASLERIWENVLDWEHLPWLHHDSFLAIDEVADGPAGWRARVLLPPRGKPRPAWIEVRLDRARLRYVTRTLAGLGEGTEIWTCLDPVADRVTRIAVEFHLPGVTAVRGARNREVGAGYRDLYARLWDEDEGMMIRRQAVLDTTAALGTVNRDPFPLGSASVLRAELPRLVNVQGMDFRILELGGELRAHTTLCPHLGGPLDRAMPDAEGCIVCPWHGYRFDLRTGKSADGRALAISAAPTVLEDGAGEASLVWPRA
jgi:nitrite reductase/ring-hydroxylating ferredoxin subunit